MYYVGGIAGAAGVLKNDKKEIKYCINIGKIVMILIQNFMIVLERV